jgi:hypothetical protein
MAAKNPLRSNHDGNAKRLWQGILHTAEVSGAYRVQGTRRRTSKQAGISEPVLTVGCRNRPRAATGTYLQI